MNRYPPRRACATTTLLVASVAALCLSNTASAETRRNFSIPAQDAAAALQAFARQSGRQVMFPYDAVRGKQTPAVSGALEDRQALLILAGAADLEVSSDDGRTVTLKASPQDGAALSRRAGAADSTRLDEVVVVGSRLARPSDGPAPATIFDREKIEALGVANVADVLNYLPQQSFAFSEGWNAGGERYAQLRGLSTGTTLVLINGRRVVPGANAAARGVVDLNSIPLAAVERVEVLSDSASAVYGADAVGGVVNIVLKSVIDRPVLDLYVGGAEGGAEERRVSLGLGGRTERARASLVLDYFDRDLLLGHKRDYSANADYRRFGGVDGRFPYANPGNICAASGNLPGLPTPCAAVPAGSTGVGLRPADFLATAGQQNLATWFGYRSLVPATRRYSATATASYDLTEAVTAFAEYMYGDRAETANSFPPAVINGLVPATNPFNPFGVPVRANFFLTGLGPTHTYSDETAHRETLGLRGRLEGWDWELAMVAAQSDATTEVHGNVDAARLAAALAATTPAQALNVFQDGPGGSFALLSSLLADPSTNRQAKTSDDIQFGGFLRGAPFDLPAGPVQTVFGGEWRKESISVVQASSGLSVTSGRAKRKSASAYAELRLPVLGGEGTLGAAGELDLTLAGRYDHFSDFGDTVNGEYGLEWRPIPTLLVRAAYGESYRAPSLYQLHQPRNVQNNVTFARDPQRRDQPFVATFISGGNPDLQPETSTSASAGVVWEPDVLGAPRISATYWRIKQDLRIVTGFNFLTLLANEGQLSERVIRAAPSAADTAAGLPGPITSLDISLLNMGSLETSGLDLAANFRFDTAYGRFTPAITATRVETYEAADFPTSVVVERVGVADTSGSIPRWKVVGSLGWGVDGIDVTATVRYVSSYDDARSNIRNGLTVDSQTFVDLQAAFRLDELTGSRSEFTDGVVIRMGATNLFDAAPPFSNIQGAGFDPSQGDPRQRFVYASISKTF